MAIEKVINGVVYEFPDGTPAAVIKRFETQKLQESTGAAFVPPNMGRKAPSPTTPPPDRPSAMGGNAAGALLQGLTFGFSDEMLAKMRSAADPRSGQQTLSGLVTGEPAPGSYESYLKAEREGLRKYGEQHPVKSTIAELAGGVAPAVITGGATTLPGLARTALSKMPSLTRMMGAGSLSGGLTAVGTSEQPAGDLPGEAAKGAVLGAATAGTLGAAGKYVVSPLFGRLKQALGFGNANKMADIAIANALQKDGLSVEDAMRAIQAMSRGQATLADLGENTAALLRKSTAAPGTARRETKDTLVTREAGRVPRVAEDLRTLMSGSRDFYTDVTDLIKKRSDDAKVLYETAWSSAPRFDPAVAPGIAQLRSMPSFKTAMSGGARRMADQGLDITDPKNTLRALHETKLELDDMIEKAMTSDRTANQARILMNMKETLLKDMEKASPAYRVARESFAGDSEMLTAMKEGQRIYQLTEPDVRKLMSRFANNPSEYDAFRAGMAQAMLEKLRTAGASTDPSKALLSKEMEDRLRRAFRDDASFDEFKKRLSEESLMLRTEKAGFRKTPTDTDLDVGASAVGAATRLATGSPVGAAVEAIQAAAPRLAGVDPKMAVPLARKLTTPASDIDPVLSSIMDSLKQQEKMLVNASFGSNIAGAAAGAPASARGIKEQYPDDGEGSEPAEPQSMPAAGTAQPAPGLQRPAPVPQ